MFNKAIQIVLVLMMSPLPSMADTVTNVLLGLIAADGAFKMTITSEREQAVSRYQHAVMTGDPQKIAQAEAELYASRTVLDSWAVGGVYVDNIGIVLAIENDYRYRHWPRHQIAQELHRCSHERTYWQRQECREMVEILSRRY